VKRWEKTRIQNLVRHQSGRYYARTFSSGKEIWKSLKTSHFSVAKARLAEVVQEHRKHAESKGALIGGKMTSTEAAGMHLQSLGGNPKLKTASRHYWRQSRNACACGRND
jgi:hypothetical protein